MKLLKNSARQLVKTMLVLGFMSAMGAAPLFAQVVTLAGLTNGGTISIDDKIFSGFSYTASGLTSFNPNSIIVTATESGGIEYLTWSGNISLVSSGISTADLVLNYIVTSTGQPIDMIDQHYTGIVTNGFLAVDETAALGAFGGTVVGYSHLEVGDTNDPPGEVTQGDNLIINPSQSVLYVTKDITLAVFPPNEDSGSVTVSQVEQSFHQVPEPTTAGCFVLGLLALACFQRFAQKRRV
jgi:hypothetical protein